MRKQLSSPELSNIKPLLLPAVFIYILLVMIMPHFGHLWDTACWSMWSARVYKHGMVAAYDTGSPVNYLPLYIYVLKAYAHIVGEEGIYKYVYLLKAFTLLFDMGSVLLICSLVQVEFKRLRYFIFGLFNIGFSYNTLIWNQVDGILTFLIFASFYTAYFKRLNLSFLLFVLALNFKLQALIFLPVLGLMWLGELSIIKSIRILVYAALLEAVILAPFLINGNTKHVLGVAFGSVDYFHYISLYAFNFWHIFLDGDLRHSRDDVFIAGFITYKQLGLILFLISSALLLVPLYYKSLKGILSKIKIEWDLETLLLTAALSGCFFFFFNTQMHERYIHPVMVFSTALAFLYRHWLQWIFISLAYALSLEFICQYLELNNYGTLIFAPKFLSGLYLAAILMLCIKLRKSMNLQKGKF